MACAIREAAAETGLSAYTIRYYEQAGLLNTLARDANGNRIFEEADLDWLKYLTCLRLTGMSIAQMRKIAELSRQGDETIPERRKILEAHKKVLRKKIDQIHNAFERLEYKIAFYTEMENRSSKRVGATVPSAAASTEKQERVAVTNS